MKLLLLSMLFLLYVGCNSGYYEGYVYDDISRKPLSTVQILDIKSGDKTFTDKKGYFKIKKRIFLLF